jgi:hypothetical protein
MTVSQWAFRAARKTCLSLATAVLLATSALAASSQPPTQTASVAAIVKAQQSWRQALLKQQLPGVGCFTAQYPNKTWRAAPCVKAPPGAQGRKFLKPDIVGKGTDYAATVTGTATSMTGSFNDVEGVRTITAGPGSQSNFALQLNTQLFSTPACGTRPNCQGWEQFIYSNTGSAFIQFWLINYSSNGTCPSKFWTYSKGGSGCYFNSPAASVPVQPLGNLSQISMIATATAGGNDTVALSTSPTRVYTQSYADNVLSLAQQWNGAEYNIVGDANGSAISFNPGVLIDVRLGVTSTTGVAPKCAPASVLTWVTQETNNLNLANDCTTSGNAIDYAEANTPLITGVAPTTGPATGGTLVTLTGTGFTGATSVTFFQSVFPATAVPFIVLSDSTITATTPACPPTTCDTTLFGDIITVTGPTGSGSALQGFHPFPRITGINPPSGPPGTAVTVEGNGFTLASPTFAFNGQPAGGVECSGNRNIACTMTVPTLETGPANVTFPGAPPNPPRDQFNVTGGAVTTCTFQLLSCPSGGGSQLYSITCGAPHDFYVDQSLQKTATVFTGQEAGAEQPTGVKACFPGTQNCQSYTTTATINCPIGPPIPPPHPLPNCRSCEETGRQCVVVNGGFKCVGNIQ